MAILYGEIDKDTKREKIHYNRGDMVASQTINDIQDTAIDAHNMATEALDKADSVFQGNGTVVSVGGREVGTLAFSSDPQQQLDTLNSKIGTASSFNAEIVDQLPTTNISTSTFYLIKNSTSAGDNTYSEYLYVNGRWELLGNTQVQAYDDSELRALINNLSTTKADKSAIPTKLPTPNTLTLKVDGVTKTEFDGSSAETVNIELPNTDLIIDIVNEHSESINEINTELASKADKSEIPSVSGLASETYVNTQVSTLQGKIDAKVDKTTTINSKPLSGNITLTASDVGALPNTTTIPKLYNDFGENTDGAVTQGAITPVLASFEGSINEFYGAFEELGGILDAKYEKPSTGIPKTDLASDVQTSLGKADTALQSIPAEYITETELNTKGYATTTDVSGKLDKVTNSTTPQVYGVDALGSQTMYEFGNTVRNGGLVSRFGEQILVPTTPTQDQSATSKSYVDKVDGEIYSHINSEIERVEGLIANAGGTVVTVGGTNKPVTTLNFDSNPQTQITNLETSLYNTKVILESNVSTNASDIDKLETSVTNLQNDKADKSEIPTNYVTTDTDQNISGQKVFNDIHTTNTVTFHNTNADYNATYKSFIYQYNDQLDISRDKEADGSDFSGIFSLKLASKELYIGGNKMATVTNVNTVSMLPGGGTHSSGSISASGTVLTAPCNGYLQVNWGKTTQAGYLKLNNSTSGLSQTANINASNYPTLYIPVRLNDSVEITYTTAWSANASYVFKKSKGV